MNERVPYKLIILGNNWDLYKISYSDIITDNTTYIDSIIPKNILLKALFKLHFFAKINKHFRLPFKGIWKYYYFRKMDKNQPTVFLFFRNWFEQDCRIGLVDFIKKTFKNSKNIIFFQDIIASFNIYGTPINIEEVKSKYDLVLSYDKDDCKRHGLIYHPTVYSKQHISPKPSSFNQYDVFFIGKDKGRLNLLIDIAKKLTEMGLKCKFIVLGDSHKNKIHSPHIEYIDKMVKYPVILEYISKSKCLLELLQDGAVGQTYRTLEAISYNKILLTNNVSIKDSDIFDPNYIHIFSSADDISKNVCNEIKNAPNTPNKFVDHISPIQLISFIEKRLNITIEY